MDALKYAAGKKSGQSGIVLQGDTTLLISCPAEQAFDPNTGAPNPPAAQGFQLADLVAMQTSAQQAVESAEDALDKAIANAAACDALVADAEAVLPKADVSLNAKTPGK